MSTKETGGPAFSCTEANYTDPKWSYEGVSMRDYFAAKAMQAGLTGATLPGLMESDPDTLALASQACKAFYLIADMMLEARK